MSLPEIEILDRDGALREAEAAVAGDTRSAFFRKAAVGGGAVLTSGAIMGMLPELAAAAKPSKKQDLKILEFALTLEYLEAAFYKLAVGNGALSGDASQFAQLVALHEQTHVEILKKVIKQATGKKAPASPSFDFMGTTDDQTKFIQTAFTLENTGVHAYLGQAGNLKSKVLLGAAATIVTTEARHAAAIATILAEDPYSATAKTSITPDGSFDVPFSKKKILKAVGDTGFIKS
jgi:hypothetical protein